MKLLAHLLMNDVRRFRGLIAIWIALVVAGVALYAWSPTLAGEPRRFAAVQTIAGLLWLTRQLFRVILIARLVHADPAVGSTAFWMTRPVPPRSLLASKVALVFGLTVAVPAAGDLLLGLVYRVPASGIGIAMLQTALANGAWAAALMTFAVLTRNLSQFAAVCGVAILCAAVGPIVLVTATRFPETPGRSGVASDPLILVVAGALLMLFLGSAWLVQYVRRSRRESVPVMVAGACVAIGFAAITEPPLVARQLEPPPSWARTATLQLPSIPPNIYTGTEVVTWGIERDRTSFAVARARVVMPQLPPGWLATALLRGATVIANGKTLTCGIPPYQASASLSRDRRDNRHATEVALSEALGVPEVVNLLSYGTDTTMLFFVPYGDRVGVVHGSYRGSFRIELRRLDAVGAFPLSGGVTFQDGAERMRMRDVRLDDGLVSIRVERSSVPTISANRRPGYDFYLRNRAHGQALGGSVRQTRGSVWAPGISQLADLANAAPGVNRWAEFLTFRGKALAPEWLAGAELVVVRTTRAGILERELVDDDFSWSLQARQ
jgi:hypothetical protein